MYRNLTYRHTKRFNQFKNHADRIINSNITEHYMYFDGVDEYINCGNDSSLDFEYLDAFSISAWINPQSLGIINSILTKRDNTDSTTDSGYYFALDSTNKLRMDLSKYSGGQNRISVSTTTTLSISNWYNVIITYSGNGLASGINFYINDSISPKDTPLFDNLGSNSIINTKNTLISSRDVLGVPSSFANMYIDEVSIWNKELTSGEVSEIYNKGRVSVDYSDMSSYLNIVSHWTMGESNTWSGSNWNVIDIKGVNDGVSVNMEYEDTKPTETITEFGSLSGSVKWVGGVLANNGNIYGIPYTSTTILKINTSNDSTTRFGSLSGSTKWQGGVLANNGNIYGIPYTSTTVLKIDPNTDTATTFGSLAGSGKWSGGILAPNGSIYGIPNNSTTVLKIEPNTDTATTFGSLAGSGKWSGGVLAPNGIIYGIPLNSTTILKIDTNTDTISTFGSLSGSATKWVGGVLSPDGRYIYAIPYNSTTVLKIDTKTDTTTEFSSLTGTAKWICGVLSSNGIIYGIPYNSTTILKIDTNLDIATTIGTVSSNNTKWYGGVMTSNGFVYGIPFNNITTVLKIDSNIINGFDENFLMSGYYNKF